MSKKCTPLWREAHFQVKMYKTPQRRITLGSCDVQKVHAVVARSTFPSQNVQNTPAPDHFWKLRCQKCTPLWREAHLEVKMLKTLGVRTTFGGSAVEKVHAVVARRTFRSQNVQNTRSSDHFWRFRCRFASLHYTTLHYTTLHYSTLHSSTLHYTTLHSSTLHYTKLHYTTLNYTTLRSTTLHYTISHYTTLHYSPLHYITLCYTIFHYTSLPYTTLHFITLQVQLQLHKYTPLHSTTLHYTPLH